MDSLSQVVLGAAVGELVLGRKIGNRAQLIGAIAGTIPDLDILSSPFIHDDLVKLTIHRAYSHSMFTHILLAIPLAWLTWRIYKRRIAFGEWYTLWFLGLFTHALLDCCTTYGTQLFLPFTNYLVGFDNISVLDPFWTVPFMLCLVVALFMKRESKRRRNWALAGVAWAGGYMLYTLANKYTAYNHFEHELVRQEIRFEHLDTSPAMLNNWLWAGVAWTADSIYVGEYSVLQSTDEVKWVAYPVNGNILTSHPARDQLETLEWFSQGKYFIQEKNSALDFYIAKWGRMDFSQTEADKAFVFHYHLQQEDGHWTCKAIQPEFGPGEFSKAWNQLWSRVMRAPSEPAAVLH